MAKSGDTRICVIHKNVPAVITQITAAVSGLNIENMINQSKKEYAYTMLDVDGSVGADIVAKIEAISGVIKVRCINH